MKHVRKWLSVLLALALVFTLLPQMALPARAEVDQAGWCGDSLRWTFDSDTGELTIYGEGNMWNWSVDDPPWQDFLKEIKKVTIESGVTDVGEFAFYLCDNLTNVKIADSVTVIGDAAFHWCEKLSGITIPYRVTVIGDGAFYQCASLTEITIPGSVTSIGRYAFEDCTKLADITVLNKDCEI